MSAPVLEIDDLRVRYAGAGRPALDGLSLAVAAGEVLAVVGESGSGKSTLALAILGLLPAGTDVAGGVRLKGEAVWAGDRQALGRWRGRRVGIAFQDALASLHPLRTVGDQLDELVARRDPDLDRNRRRERVLALAAEVGLDDPGTLLARHPHRLSGGQRQRAGIALALAGRPEVLVADEVTSALDPPRAAAIAALLRRLADAGLAVIAVAHDLDRIGTIADRLVVLRRGAMVEAGRARDLLSRPRSPYLRNLLASRPRLDANPPRLPVAGPDDAPIAPSAPVAPVAPVATIPERPRAPVLSVGGLSVRHGRVAALTRITFDLSAGEVLGVVGPSGCGKSTLARALLRLDRAHDGAIAVEGRDLLTASGAALADLRRRIGLVFQDPAASLDPRLPAWRSIAEPLVVAAVGDVAGRRRRALELLREVGLAPEHADRRPHALSGGQQQRVAIARALALSPPILVCDEAVSALDVGVQAGILNLLRDQCERRGLAVLFISHDLAAVRFVADRVLVLDAGRIVESGPVAEVLSHPSHPASRSLLAATPRPIEAA
jgi:peptide/nickel transport system ATP-binding protein